MDAAGASRAGGSWTAGLELRGFVGIHLSTDAPGLPVHEPAVVIAPDLHAARCSTRPAPPPATAPYRIHARERQRRNRPQPLPQRTRRISLLCVVVGLLLPAQRESAIGRRELKAHPRRHNRRIPRRQQSRSLAVGDAFLLLAISAHLALARSGVRPPNRRQPEELVARRSPPSCERLCEVPAPERLVIAGRR
jgi:hypothetical protein